MEAGERLELSYRQAKRLYQKYKQGGTAALKHGNAGQGSNRAKPKQLRERVLELVRENYGGGEANGLGPTLAAEHLAAEHGLAVDHETLRRWMKTAGLWQRRRKRAPQRKRRTAKEHFGELLQLDGSHHRWLEERGGKACLMNLVDDATGRGMFGFADEETTWAAADLLERWMRRFGAPQALYCDWKNVYLRQAKGRVERHHATHQDRLVKKMRLSGIADYDAANRFLEGYGREHNERFGRRPAAAADFHLKLPRRLDLRRVFCLSRSGWSAATSWCATRIVGCN